MVAAEIQTHEQMIGGINSALRLTYNRGLF